MTITLSLAGLERFAAELGDVDQALQFIGERARAVVLEEGMHDTGGDLVLSHFAQGRVRLDAEVRPSGATVEIRGTPPGPWTLIESGSHKSAWLEPRAPGKRGRRGTGKRLSFGPDEVRISVTHGPVRGKRTFSRARDRIAVEARDWLDEWLTDNMRRAS